MSHKKWISHLPCCVCYGGGASSGILSDPHHVKTKGAGGQDWHLVPLCRFHHQQFHAMGRHTFQKRYDIDLLGVAERLWRVSPYRVCRSQNPRQPGKVNGGSAL